MPSSSVLRVKLTPFIDFNRQNKNTSLSSCLYLPFIFIRNGSFKVLQGLSLNKYSNVTELFRSQKFTWPPCDIMKDRGREIARWRAFLGTEFRWDLSWLCLDLMTVTDIMKSDIFHLTTSKDRISAPVSWLQAAQRCHYSSRLLRVNIKRSLYKPGQVLRVPWCWGSQFSWQSAHGSGKVVCPTYRLPLPPRKYSKYSFLLKDESTPAP